MTEATQHPIRDVPATSSIAPARLGPFIVDRSGLRLLHQDADTGIDGQQLKLLGALIDAWPGVVSKEELLDKVWGGYVSEAALHKTVSLLRRHLSTLSEGTEFIRTRHRHGYQLLVEPQPVEEAASTPVSANSATPVARRRGRTVLAVGIVLIVMFTAWLAIRPTPPAPASPARTAPAPILHATLAERSNDDLLALARESTPADLDLAAAAADTLRARVDPQTEPGLAGLANKQAGLVAYFRGDHAQAIALFEAAIAPLQAAEDWTELANVLGNIGASLVDQGDAGEQAASRYRQALAIWQRLGDAAGQTRTHNNLVNLHLRRGDMVNAEKDLIALERLVPSLSDPAWEVRVATLRGDVQRAAGHPEAHTSYTHALDHATRAGLPDLAAIAAQRLARMAEQDDDHVQAHRWLMQARKHLEAAGNHAQLPTLMLLLATNRERMGLAEEAMDTYRSVLDALGEQPAPSLRADAQVGIARLLVEAGHINEARQRLERAARDARLSGNPLALASVRIAQGFHALSADESPVGALALAHEAGQLLAGIDSWTHQRNLLALTGLALAANEHHDDALLQTRRLRDEATRRQDIPSRQQADMVDATIHLLRGDFTRGYRALRQATGVHSFAQHAGAADNPEVVPVSNAIPTTPQMRLPVMIGIGVLLVASFVAGRLTTRSAGRKR